MTRDMIVTNIQNVLTARKAHAAANDGVRYDEYAFPITFTHAKKEAKSCVILLVEPSGEYTVRKFETKFADIKDPIRDVYHGALFDCDDDVDQMDTLLDQIAGKEVVNTNDENQDVEETA